MNPVSLLCFVYNILYELKKAWLQTMWNKNGESNCVFYFTVHLPVVASPVEVAAAMTGGVKRLFLRHILQYYTLVFSFCTRFFCSITYSDAKQFSQGFSNPINHIQRVCFSREETEIKGSFAQNTGSRWYNNMYMYINFNPDLLLYQQQ